MHAMHTRAQQVLDSLQYDFTQFQIGHFIHHIQTLRGRPIQLYSFPFEIDVFGLWVAGQRTDYLVYRNSLCQVHRDHTVLHELGHMLLDHHLKPLQGLVADSLLKTLGETELSGRLRTASADQTDREEVECEAFVLLFQAQVTRASRLDALTGTSSSIDPLRPFTEAMAFAQEPSAP